MADDTLPSQDSLTEDPAVVGRHRRLAELLDARPGHVVADLGCGDGVTLASVAESMGARTGRAPGLVVGVDRDLQALAQAARTLTGTGAGTKGEETRALLLAVDAARGIPLRSESVDRVVSHNLLECLPDPGLLLSEAHRLLRPGGRLVLGHADFDTLVFAGADLGLTRALVHAYCDTQQPWMAAVDGTIGRKLAGVAAASSLRLRDFTAWVLLSSEWRPGMLGHGYAHHVAAALARHDGFPQEVRSGWLADLEAAAAKGAFLFSLNEYIAVLERP